jgi:hypothetical protein
MPRRRLYELGQAIRTLETALDSPCDCGSTGHEAQCESGRVAIVATLHALRWAMGQPSGFDKVLSGLREIQLGRPGAAGPPKEVR